MGCSTYMTPLALVLFAFFVFHLLSSSITTMCNSVSNRAKNSTLWNCARTIDQKYGTTSTHSNIPILPSFQELDRRCRTHWQAGTNELSIEGMHERHLVQTVSHTLPQTPIQIASPIPCNATGAMLSDAATPVPLAESSHYIQLYKQPEQMQRKSYPFENRHSLRRVPYN